MSKVPAPAGSTRDDTWRYRRLGGSLLLNEADLRLLDSLRPVCARCGVQGAQAFTGGNRRCLPRT